MSEDLRARAEELWEAIGVCICATTTCPHWCESCQHKIDVIAAALTAPGEPAVSETAALMAEAKRKFFTAPGEPEHAHKVRIQVLERKVATREEHIRQLIAERDSARQPPDVVALADHYASEWEHGWHNSSEDAREGEALRAAFVAALTEFAALTAPGEPASARALRRCGFCHALREAPCGNGCLLHPTDPTWEQELAALTAPGEPHGTQEGLCTACSATLRAEVDCDTLRAEVARLREALTRIAAPTPAASEQWLYEQAAALAKDFEGDSPCSVNGLAFSALCRAYDAGRAEALTAPGEPSLCGEANGIFVCNLLAGHDGNHEDRAENGGTVAWER